MSSRLIRFLLVLTLVFTAAATVPMSGAATDVSPDLFAGLQWRNIGPFHGGRISAVTGRHRPAGRVLRRHAGRRRLEDHQRRRDVVPDLRPVHRRRQHRRRSRSRRPIRTSSTPAPAIPCRARSATACTSPPTPARRGRTSASRRRRKINKIVVDPEGSRTSSSRRRRATRGTTARASIARPTAAGRGRTRCGRRTRTARATSSTRSTCRT